MPELPEVETVRRSLERLVTGQSIVAVQVREARLRRPLANDFAATLTGRVIRQISRRGKYLHFSLDDGHVWLVHLGMTGRLVAGAPAALLPHDHVLIALSNGLCLRYNDTRRFGLMMVGTETSLALLTGLGVEPLGRAFSVRYLWTRAQATQRAVKDLLIDQRVVAGIGNIYVCELLFRAGVRPERIAMTLDQPAVKQIVKATKMVLREAICHRGSSIADYLDGEGNPGSYQKRFCVYGRAGESCPQCATPIRREMRGGRSSFFCPNCQQ
jgi:formamidopyrimidine-DNA glycosylase